MSFCKFSTEFVASSQTEVDNIFINDYLPYAPSDYVKVYIFGLYLCKSGNEFDNNLATFAQRLNMKEEEIEQAFLFWQEQGLVQVLKTYPIEVRFVPLKNIVSNTKLYNPDKYAAFNSQAQELFAGKREISKTEYGEYYDFLERFHVEQEALLMIIKYCIDNKNSAVGYNYILTVAKNWANEGIVTAAQVEERLQSFEQKDQEIEQVLKALGIRRAAFIEERNMLNKWMQELGFDLDVILYLAKALKKKGRANFLSLDGVLLRYFELKLFSILEIEEFEKNKTQLFALAKSINKAIGVFYESLDSEIENYILRWINWGFDNELLVQIANYCFKNSVRTLEGMDGVVTKFYKKGIISLDAFDQYVQDVIAADNVIAALLEKLGLARKVNYLDRETYKTWASGWGFSQDVIDYAATLSVGKEKPLQYMGKILASWHDKGISTLQQAKDDKLPNFAVASASKNQNFKGRSYEGVDASALFQSLEEVEI